MRGIKTKKKLIAIIYYFFLRFLCCLYAIYQKITKFVLYNIVVKHIS